MPERVIGLGNLAEHLPREPWVLVLGGVSREGNRRARRAVRTALESDLSVLWFDGFGERSELGQARLALDVPVPDGSVTVVDYADVEQAHWLNRMVEGIPTAMVSPVEKVESGLTGHKPGVSSLVTKVRRAVQKATAVFRTKVLRRIAQIFRGIVGWNIVRDDISLLADSASPPIRIVYGDDFALTQGWRVARIWTEVPTSMELPEG